MKHLHHIQYFFFYFPPANGKESVIPDGMEICGKNIRDNLPWIVTCADPPIGGSGNLTVPELG